MKLFNVLTLMLALAIICFATPTVNVTFTGTGGISNGTDYVFPYYLIVDGLNISAPCLSDSLDIIGGEQWTATEQPVDYSMPNATDQRYLEEIVYLYTQFNGTNNVPVQQAIWNLGNNISGVTGPYTDVGTQNWLDQASAQSLLFLDSVSSNYSVLIPVGDVITGIGLDSPPGSPQFFLEQTPVPETLTFFLCGSGLILLGFTKKLKRN